MLKRLFRAIAGLTLVSDRSAVAAVEFAIILPILMLMLMGGAELSSYITAANRSTFIPETIGELVSRSDKTLGEKDMAGFIKMAALVDPNVIRYAAATGKALEKAVDVTVSSVAFSLKNPACKKDCVYDAKVVFSEALSGTKRACGTLQSGEDATMSTLPAGTFGPGSIVVVDVVAYYQPLLTSFLDGTVAFRRSTYFRPRQVPVVNYVKNCPGFPTT